MSPAVARDGTADEGGSRGGGEGRPEDIKGERSDEVAASGTLSHPTSWHARGRWDAAFLLCFIYHCIYFFLTNPF